MRWDGQAVGAEDPSALPGLGRMSGLVRSVTTPEFHGITFHEVMAKSALNRVPGGALPFDWTINPYRGCSHACTFCVVGETPVLMADGRSRPISGLAVGDEIYGTVRVGNYRRYTVTKVLAHWTTVKRAFRVTLEDGTELVASGDHRFLTDRGWKHVTGRMCGAGQRPYLTTGNKLMGLGRLPESPKDCDEYRRGYLAGMIRGDGHAYEALERTREYLAGLGIEPRSFEALRALVEWPSAPSEDWRKGFLAGIFDAEGSCSDSLRISNTDAEIIEHTVTSMARLGFECTVENLGKPNGMRVVRLLGGLVAQQRFFHCVDPAITRKRSITGTAVKSKARLKVLSVEDLGLELPMYDITTGTGDFIANGVISHNCFARPTHSYLELDVGDDFDRQIVVKTNVVDVLRRELARQSWRHETVALGTNTDPYQRAEGRYRLMPGIIDALAGSGTPFSVLTKGTLLRRDLDRLTAAAERVKVWIGVSIGHTDDVLRGTLEKGAPTTRARIDLVRAVREAGLPCGVMVAPVLPWLTDSDDQLDDLLGRLADAGATGATLLTLHLRPGTKEWFMAWLSREHPELVTRYRQLYGRGAYVPASYRNAFAERTKPLLAKHGFDRPSGHRGATPAAPPAEPSFEQQHLF